MNNIANMNIELTPPLVELKKINLYDDFPKLGTTKTTKTKKNKTQKLGKNSTIILGMPSYGVTREIENKKEQKKRIAMLKNTKLCKAVIDNTQCEKMFCSYAHTVEDLKPKHCIHSERCWNKNCEFFHDGYETPDSYIERMGYLKYLGINAKSEKTTSINTKLCSSLLKGWKNCKVDCAYAHCTDDLKPLSCNFKELCIFKDENCKFIHPEETKGEYLRRLDLLKYQGKEVLKNIKPKV